MPQASRPAAASPISSKIAASATPSIFEVGTRSVNERVHYPDVDLVMERDEKGRRYLHKNGKPYP